jgi:hypothetical protein
MKKSLSTIHFFLLSALILLNMPFLVEAQEPNWLVRLKQQKWLNKVINLKVLKTSRIEAEKILGKPEVFKDGQGASSIEYYTIENGRVTLTYTTKECTSTDGKISKDTIEEIDFDPETDISFSKLRLPRKQFKKVPYSDTPGFNYENELNGVRFGVGENKIHSVEFFVPEHKNFNCVTPSSFLSDLEKVKNIKLLESNREEVRKLFAGYEKSNIFKNSEYNDVFYSSDASFEFSYSEGKCQFDDSDQYESSEWNVQSVKISPIDSIDPKEFGIDLTKFRKEQMYKNVPDLYVYYDKDSGISFRTSQGKIDEINFFPQQKYNFLMCDKERAKILSSTESLFTEKLRDRIHEERAVASVNKLNISQNEIILNCNSSNAIENKDCSNNPQTINVFTRVNNPNGDVLTYSYTVTVGKIIGQGAKVIWDLSGVKAGTYKITAAVDDGCGFCGAPKTKLVVVKECSNCR